jgi:outer membrane protein OmpA-like peptidoglycan-associated protein
MAANLIDLVRQSLPADLIGNLVDRTGESPAHLEKAVQGGIPALLAGLLHTASSPSGASRLANMLSGEEGARAGDFLSAASGLLGGRTDDLLKFGMSLLGFLFGGKQNAVMDLISRFSGVKSGTATSLLAGLAPLVLGVLKRQAGPEASTGAGLTRFLMGQKSAIASAAPAGLGDALGLGNLANLGQATTDAARRAAGDAASYGMAAAGQAADAVGSGLSWLKWAVPLALLGLLGIWLLSNYRGAAAPGNPPPVAQIPAAPPAEPIGSRIREAGEKIDESARGAGKAVREAASDAATNVRESARYVGKAASDAAANVREAASDTAASVRAAAGKMAQLRLPGGVNLDVPEGSGLNKLATFLTAGGSDGKPAAFGLEGLRFEGDTATVNPEATSVLDKLAAILKAFPAAELKIEGYTDGTGDPDANSKRALDRANAVKGLLVKAGVPSDRITTEAVNSEAPDAAARAKIGPIGLVVMKK